MPAGTIVPSGVLVSPGGQQGIPGPSTIGLPFLTKTAVYTLTSSDVGKYIICSGGSWTLTLPSPAIGYFQVRNDMGIAAGSTTGTITLAPVGGTIDGQASIPLLPQQECTLITDGTNWRTFGLKREVILGTLDITAAAASATVLLPTGYRVFTLDFDAFVSSADSNVVYAAFSSDGGSTFSTSHYYTDIYNSSTTAVAASFSATAALGVIGFVGLSTGGQIQVKVYPGASNQRCSWLSQGGYYIGAGFNQETLLHGFVLPNGLMNAAKFTLANGTINNMFLTVKGVV